MLFVKDAEHLRFVRWNRAEEEALGIDRSAAIGKSDYDFFPEEQARFFEAKDRAVLTGGQMVDIPEEAIQTAHRGLRFLHTIKVPVFGADGKPKYLVGISEDITDRKRAQEELARAREQEVEIGFRIQQTLLLEQPPQDLPGVSAAALTIPSQRIDGDFYDFFNHRDNCLDVIVGDVMGKGIPAALLGAATKSHFLQALSRLMSLSAPGTLPEPKDIVTLAHAEVARQLIELESFVTVCYARFDLVNRPRSISSTAVTRRRFTIRRAPGTLQLLQGENLPLGVSEREIFEQIRSPVEPGDVLLFYSDGLTETRNAAGELFGIERLAECVRQHPAISSPGADRTHPSRSGGVLQLRTVRRRSDLRRGQDRRAELPLRPRRDGDLQRPQRAGAGPGVRARGLSGGSPRPCRRGRPSTSSSWR